MGTAHWNLRPRGLKAGGRRRSHDRIANVPFFPCLLSSPDSYLELTIPVNSPPVSRVSPQLSVVHEKGPGAFSRIPRSSSLLGGFNLKLLTSPWK